VEVVGLQQAVDLSFELINDDYAGYPGHTDTVLFLQGREDSVSTFSTPLGNRTAIVKMPLGVTLIGDDQDGSVIDQTDAEYGILCIDVDATTVIRNLSIIGGIGRDRGRPDDGDGRALVAGISCFDNASPLISDVLIEEAATGIVIRSDSAPTIENTLIARGSHHGIYVFENGITPVTVDHLTITDNFDRGVDVTGGSIAISNSCITHNGKQGVRGYQATPTVEYSNVYKNDEAGLATDPQHVPQNYGGTLDDLTGIDGNISEEPFYCDFDGDVGYAYTVCFESPNLGAGAGGTDIGAFGGGCSECIESLVEPASWGAIKAMYR
jgi:hypothetical protein